MQKRSPKYPISGWINLYKPYGLGSTSAVGAVKRLLRPQKIGHAGTLDPLAEGVLPLALGEATKTVPYMMDARKTYEFRVVWGEARSTDDAEGEVIETSDVRPTDDAIKAVLPQFSGRITQIPPAYSAIKIDGKRAYDLARAGEDVQMKPREVEVFSLELDSRLRGNDEENASKSPRKRPAQFIAAEGSENLAETTFVVTCSKGTYVRSLARDIARALGTVGYVSYLKRAAVGRFCETNAISLDFLEDFVHKAPSLQEILASEWLLPVSDALDDIPALTLDATAEKALRHGQFIPDSYDGEESELAVYVQGKLVAFVSRQNGLLKPKRVFNC
jgi:tRNA pseudouridine55 synthase